MDYLTRDEGAPSVPALGLGTWQLQGDALRRALDAALDLGYRHIDSAQGYGNEGEIGEVLARSGIARDQIFLTTKVWPDHLVDEDPVDVVRRSLERLGVAQVDLLLLHWPSPRLPLEAVMPPLRRVHELALAREIGVSNFPPGLLRRACAMAPISCQQIECHPYLAQDGLVGLGRELGLWTAAYSPLAQGRVADDRVLRDIGRSYGASPAQVALRWLLQRGIAAIPKAGAAAHLAEDIDIFRFDLSTSDLRRIATRDSGLRLMDPEFAPEWNDEAVRR